MLIAVKKKKHKNRKQHHRDGHNSEVNLFNNVIVFSGQAKKNQADVVNKILIHVDDNINETVAHKNDLNNTLCIYSRQKKGVFGSE